MKTVVSKTGIEVLYPCTVHLLKNGEILECEYKSDHTGKELMDYVCQYQNLSETDCWGLRFVDVFDQRHWLEMDQLIRPQVKNVCPIHFHFRVKVYQPEPYKIKDLESQHQMFMQLRYDLMNGRLCCGPNDSALLLALILQYINGDYNPIVHLGNYVKDKVLMNQSFAVETKAMEIHKDHLNGLTKAQVEDLFLRMACQLLTYGVDPHIVESAEKVKSNLWINYKGIATYADDKNEHIPWLGILSVEPEQNKLLIHAVNDQVVEFTCTDEAECKYIYRSIMDHLTFFTSSGRKSTITLIGSVHGVENNLEEGNVNANTGNDKNELNLADEHGSYQKSNDTLVNFNCTPTVSTKKPHPLYWLFSKVYVIHVAILICVVGMVSQFYSLFGEDVLGLSVLKQQIRYMLLMGIIFWNMCYVPKLS